MATEMLDDMEFEQKLDEMKKDGTLPEFTARTVYDLKKHCLECTSNLPSKKVSAVSGGIAGTIVAVVIAVVEYFTKK